MKYQKEKIKKKNPVENLIQKKRNKLNQGGERSVYWKTIKP